MNRQWLPKFLSDILGSIDSLQEVRDTLLNGMMIVISAAAFPALVIGSLEAFKQGHSRSSLIYLGLYLPVLAATLFQKKISFQWRSLVLLGGLYLLAAQNLFMYGISGAGIDILLTVCVLATMLLGWRSGVFSIGFSILALLTAGLSLNTGLVSFDPTLLQISTTPIAWMTAGLTFIMLSGGLVVTTGLVQNFLQSSIHQVRGHQNQLNETQERFRLLFQEAPIAYQSLDEQGRLIQANKTWYRQLGYTKEDVIGQWLGEIIASPDKEKFQEMFEHFKQVGQISDVNIKMVKADGSTLIASYSGSIHHDPQGNFINTHCVFRDITAQLKAEQERIKSERKYKNLFSSIRDAILIANTERDITDCNPAFEELFGYTLEEIQGKKTVTLYENRDQFEELGQKIREHQGKIDFAHIVNYRKKSGEIFPGETNVFYLKDNQGNPEAFVGLIRDVSERLKAIQRLEDSEKRYRNLFERIPIGLYRTTADGQLTAANQTLLNILGYPDLETFLEVDIDNLYINPNDREKWGELIAQNGVVTGFETRFRRYDGSIVWVQDNTRAIYDGSGEIQAYEGSLEDISLRVQAEKEKEGYQEQLQALVEIEREIGSTLDLSTVLQKITTELNRIIPFDSITVQLLQNDYLEVTASQGFNTDHPVEEIRFPLTPEYPNQKVIETKEPVAFDIVADVYPRFEKDFKIYGEDVIKSWLGVPLIHQNQAIGMFTIDRLEVSPFTESEIKIAEQFANQAAIAITNARLHEVSNRQIERLESLWRIDQTITSSLDLELSLKIFLNEVTKSLEVDAAAVLLYDPDLQELSFARGTGFQTDLLQHTVLGLGEGYAGKAALEDQKLFIPELAADHKGSLPLPRIIQEGFVSYYAQPLKTKGDLLGVLEILHRSRLDPERDWFDFAENLARQAAITIDSITRMENLEKTNMELSLAADAIIEGWSKSLEIHGLEPEGHSKRTADLTLRLARRMGIQNKRIAAIRRGSLLHDIGKLSLPDRIHHKPGPLNEEEWDLVRQHPLYAVEFLKKVDFLKPALDIPRYHHERWDGSGYPEGLEGEAIPLSARIFAVADVWDILRCDRPYRSAWTTNKTLQYLKEQRGKLFDPRVVEEFLGLWEQLKGTG